MAILWLRVTDNGCLIAVIDAMNLDVQRFTSGNICGNPLLFYVSKPTHTPMHFLLLCIFVPMVLVAQTRWKSWSLELCPLWDCIEWRVIKFLRSASARLLAAIISRRVVVNEYFLWHICTSINCTTSTYDQLHRIDHIRMSTDLVASNPMPSIYLGPSSGHPLNFLFMFVIVVANIMNHTLLVL